MRHQTLTRTRSFPLVFEGIYGFSLGLEGVAFLGILVGTIIARFESRGFKLTALKLVHATPEHLEKRPPRPILVSITLTNQPL